MNNSMLVKARSRVDIETLARDVRGLFGINGDDRASMLPLLEHVLPEVMDGYEFRVVEDGAIGTAEAITDFMKPIITFTNSVYQRLRVANGRARFTAAHELGHLLMHTGRGVGYARGNVKPYQCPEWQADAFAGAFMMPSNGFRGLSSVDEAAALFGVSRSAAQTRAKTLGVRLADFPKKKER